MRRIAFLVAGGLLATGCGQIVYIPASIDGVTISVESKDDPRRIQLDKPGYAHFLSPMFNVVYRVDPEQDEQVFGPAMAAMRAAAADLPALRHSYVALLPSPEGPLGHLAFEPAAGPAWRIEQAGAGRYIDGYPESPRDLTPERIREDFGTTLETQAAIRKSLDSYVFLRPWPEADTGALVLRAGDVEVVLDRAGQGLNLDGVPFDPDPDRLTADLAAGDAALGETLAQGLPELPHSRTLLLQHLQGPVGELHFLLNDGAAPKILGEAGKSLFIDGYPAAPQAVAADRLQRDFGDALAAQAAAEKALRSHAVLLADPAGGAPGQLLCMARGETLRVEATGEGCTLDALPFVPDGDDLRRDTAPGAEALGEILAAGLPELAHSRIILLPHYMGSLGSLEFEANDALWRHELRAPSQEVFIDGYPDQPHAVDIPRIRRDFGPALDDLSDALKSLRSYLILLKSPDGAASKVVYRTRESERMLEHPGESLTLDGMDVDPDQTLAEADFTLARGSTREILDAGLPELPHSYAALLESPSGDAGEVEILEGHAQGVLLRLANEAVIIDGYSNQVFLLPPERLQRDFGETRAALPPPPAHFILYFDSGNTRLNPDSRTLLPLILDEIRRHPAADLSIDGHSDSVGHDALNGRLSLERARTVAAMIEKSGVPVAAVELAGHGKSLLAVATPDNTPEPLNRRVEITIR